MIEPKKAGRKPGSPNKRKNPNTRTKAVSIRLSVAELDEALYRASAGGETLAEYARRAIGAGRIRKI